MIQVNPLSFGNAAIFNNDIFPGHKVQGNVKNFVN